MIKFNREALNAVLPEHLSSMPIKSIKTEIIIHRGDGRVEDKGVVAFWHESWIHRFWWNICHFFRR